MRRLGIDVGGTFTDFVLVDEAGQSIRTWKVSSTPSNYARAVQDGMLSGRVQPETLATVVYGTTIGVNTIIERTGAVVGLLTTRGFEDILDIGWMTKPEMYSLFYRKPRPLVLRRNRIGIDERVDARGKVLRGVDAEEVRQRVLEFKQRGVQSLAISTINAYANPVNEIEIARIVREMWAEVPLSLSHQIVSQRREFERTSTTVLNAYIALKLEEHFGALAGWLRKVGFRGTFYVMRSNGGVMTLERAKTTPVLTLLSGPVGGSIACQTLGAKLGLKNLIGFDMGGTSTDISVIHDGKPIETAEATVEGLPLMTPVIAINYIGSGGGSICRIEGETSLRVGPESAGAEPGPACYGRGGKLATTTDANLTLGALAEDIPLAETVYLNRSLAEQAVQTHIAELLHKSLMEAAEGILRVANVKMAYAIRAETVGRGLDPREFTLIAFGGAGPMHAAAVAAELGIPQVIIPPAPGNLSAWGMLNTDIRHDLVRTISYAGVPLDVQTLADTFRTLDLEGRRELESEGVPGTQVRLNHAVDMRYVGQEHTLTVQLPEGEVDEAIVQETRARFHQAYQRRYGFSNPHAPTEIVNVRLEAIGLVPRSALKPKDTENNGAPLPRSIGTRRVIFDSEVYQTPVYQRADLPPTIQMHGPAVIIESGCTTLLPPKFKLSVDRFSNLILTMRQDEA